MESILPGIWKLTLGEPEAVTPARVHDVAPWREGLEALPDAGAPPFTAGDLAFRAGPRGCVLELPMAMDEAVYGFGLQLKSHLQTGKKKVMRVNSDPVFDTGDSHAPVPFYVTANGYGVYIDTARYASFYCGSHARMSEVRALQRRDAPETDINQLYKLDAQPNRVMVVDIPVARGVDVYVFGGPDMRAAVQRYVLFSGGGCLPPLWGLGVWYRCYGKFTQDQARALAEALRAEHMPCDVYGLEPGWQSHAYPCTFTWSNERFPDPAGFLNATRELGFKVNLWEHVFVDPGSPLYEPLFDQGGSYPGMGGLTPDLSVAGQRERFAAHHREELVAKGVDGFKLDECDNSDFINHPWSFPEPAEFPSGLDGEQMHTLLGLLYQRTIHDAFTPLDRRTYCQVRASGALAAPYPFVLYSDLYDHRDFVRGVVNAGFGGLLWSPEVRHAGSVEELARRVAAVVFSPQALVNAWYIQHPPWHQVERDANNEGRFMAEREEATAICRRLFEWRMRLLPYLYAAFARYRFEGLPPFRALVMDYPDEPGAREVDDAWLMGDGLLVAPMFAGQAEREVYLPGGAWYDVHTGARHEGGQSVRVAVPLDAVGLFAREGAIVPLAEPVQYVAEDTVFRVTAHAYGKPCAPFMLFEDDATTFAYERGAANRVTLRYDGGEPSVERTGDYAGRRYDIVGWEHHGG